MRAGTQTLIQALQAMPWVEDQDNDDEIHPDITPGEPESDEDDNFGLSGTAYCFGSPLTCSACSEPFGLVDTHNLPPAGPVSARQHSRPARQ